MSNAKTANSDLDKRVDEIVWIIQASRRFQGQADLADNLVLNMAHAWLSFLESIPTLRLRECYELVAGEGLRSKLTPKDLQKAWMELRPKQGPPPLRLVEGQETFHCWLCRDSGWQRVEIFCHSANRPRQVQRACSCDAAPRDHRSQSALSQPEWEMNRDGVWQVTEHGTPLPCRCLYCKSKVK